jgi:hypothetical protein
MLSFWFLEGDMLTKEQVNRAYGEMKFATVSGGKATFPQAESDASLVATLNAAYHALAAYERVTALVENLRTMAVLSVEEHDHNMRVADMIDRSLEG